MLVRVNAFFYAFFVPHEVLLTYAIPRDRVRVYRGPEFAYLIEPAAERPPTRPDEASLRRCRTCCMIVPPIP